MVGRVGSHVLCSRSIRDHAEARYQDGLTLRGRVTDPDQGIRPPAFPLTPANGARAPIVGDTGLSSPRRAETPARYPLKFPYKIPKDSTIKKSIGGSSGSGPSPKYTGSPANASCCGITPDKERRFPTDVPVTVVAAVAPLLKARSRYPVRVFGAEPGYTLNVTLPPLGTPSHVVNTMGVQ